MGCAFVVHQWLSVLSRPSPNYGGRDPWDYSSSKEDTLDSSRLEGEFVDLPPFPNFKVLMERAREATLKKALVSST